MGKERLSVSEKLGLILLEIEEMYVEMGLYVENPNPIGRVRELLGQAQVLVKEIHDVDNITSDEIMKIKFLASLVSKWDERRKKRDELKSFKDLRLEKLMDEIERC